MILFNDFYRGKKVLVTGHTGFKGAWLSFWLKELGAEVYGLGMPPRTHPDLHNAINDRTFKQETICDIRVQGAISEMLEKVKPDFVFHLAAQALVRKSYDDPIETFETNALGTAYLLDSIRFWGLPCPVIVVTSDKVYHNQDWEFGYRETDKIGGKDPYSMSKTCAELIARSWYDSFFKNNPKLGPIATVRAGNVIGGGDYAQDRIVPDCIRALEANQPVKVRNLEAVRPWQHVFDCLSGYLLLGSKLGTAAFPGPWNFGPDSVHSVADLLNEIFKTWPGTWTHEPSPENKPCETRYLTLCSDKAKAHLKWRPVYPFAEAAHHTAIWYHSRRAGSNMVKYSLSQLVDYITTAHRMNLPWTL